MHLPEGTLLQNGKYKIVRFIASGGFGCTYEGEQTILGVRVAIKELFVSDFCNREDDNTVNVGTKSKVDDFQKIKKSFIKEAAVLYQMQNHNIVRVTDVFEENGTAYYIMDYIDGSSLADIVSRKGKLEEEEAIGYIRQVCDALKYVHGQNRLHLDIKPGNIMVDKNGKALLIDFGTSKYYDEETGEQTSTLLGILTKPYAPLEQINGSFNTFNPSADIYSLGATLYKLLTGITPTSALDRLSRRKELKPLPSTISEPTRKAVEAALKIYNEDRPQSIEDFERLLNDKYHNKDSDATVIDNNAFKKPHETESIISENSDPKNSNVEDAKEATVFEKPSSQTNVKSINTSTSDNRNSKSAALKSEEEKVKTEISNPKDTYEKVSPVEDEPLKPTSQPDSSLPERSKSSKKTIYIGIAATIVLFIICFLIFGGSDSNESRYDQNRLAEEAIDIDEETPEVSISKFITDGEINGHEYVDLGLSSGLKWATCNVGASDMQDYGDYFYWGATEPDSCYREERSETYDKSSEWLHENGYIDEAGNLTFTYDTARQNWGASWRMPTKDEFYELLQHTTSQWTEINGVEGRLIKSNKNGRTIFLPACGWIFGTTDSSVGIRASYWSSTPYSNETWFAYPLYFSDEGLSLQEKSHRAGGFPVRPVSN